MDRLSGFLWTFVWQQLCTNRLQLEVVGILVVVGTRVRVGLIITRYGNQAFA